MKQRPEITHLLASPPFLPLPKSSDVYFIEFTFNYADENGIRALAVNIQLPDGKSQETIYSGSGHLRSFGFERSTGEALYRTCIKAKNQLGTYKFTFTVTNTEGVASKAVHESFRVVAEGTPKCEIIGVDSDEIAPGDLITIRGLGFDASSAKANIVTIGGQVAAVQEVFSNEILIRVPDRISRGQVSVFNKHGIAQSLEFLELRAGKSAWSRFLRMSSRRERLISDDVRTCTDFFSNLPSTDPIHAGIDTMTVGSFADVLRCLDSRSADPVQPITCTCCSSRRPWMGREQWPIRRPRITPGWTATTCYRC